MLREFPEHLLAVFDARQINSIFSCRYTTFQICAVSDALSAVRSLFPALRSHLM
mgnify:FL=1